VCLDARLDLTEMGNAPLGYGAMSDLAHSPARLAYEEAQAAYRNPMLALLSRRDAPLVVGLLGLVFNGERTTVSVADVHAEVTMALTELSDAGFEVPDKAARELCRNWVDAGWLATQSLEIPSEVGVLVPDGSGTTAADHPLRHPAAGSPSSHPAAAAFPFRHPAAADHPLRHPAAADYPLRHPAAAAGGTQDLSPAKERTEVEVYRLTAHAVAALEVANRAAGNRASVSRSRILTLLAAVNQLASDIDPSLDSRVERLKAEIKEREAQIAELQAGGIVPQAPIDQLLESAETVLLQVRELPADFARVAESVKTIQRDTVQALRAEDRPTGEVLRDYLERAEHLMEATAEGRAFGGALQLLEDHQKLEQLNQNLQAVLSHPFADSLTPAQRRDLAGIGRLIESGLAGVLTARRQATHVVTQAVSHLDPMRDRQVDDLLRMIISGLGEWIPGSRRGQEVPAARRLARADIGRPRGELAELGRSSGPAPVAHQPVAHEPSSFAEAKAWGGPNYEALEHLVITEIRQSSAEHLAVSDIFANLPTEARRPVDLVGLLELAATLGLHDDGAVAEVIATRPDGSTTRLAFESATLVPAPHPEESHV